MLLTGHKNLIVALLLMAFICQSVAASSMFCPLMSSAKSDHIMTHDMAVMDHSAVTPMSHPMDHAMSSMDEKKLDCCKVAGHCVSGGCSLANLGSTFTLSLPAMTSNVEHFYNSVKPLTLTSSLYRPPIFR